MNSLKTALKQLAAGEFICDIRYPESYEALQDPQGRDKAQEWLEAIGYRLARLSDEGAFFMAYGTPTVEMRTQVRDELKTIRNKLEPIVGFMETLRQSQGRTPQVHAGDMIWESEITEAIRNSSLLERRITEMRDINGVRVTDTTHDRVRRMLSQLEAEGYLEETNATNKGYQITGKIDYLYQLIAFIAANSSHLADEGMVDQIERHDVQMRLDRPDTLKLQGQP